MFGMSFSGLFFGGGDELIVELIGWGFKEVLYDWDLHVDGHWVVKNSRKGRIDD